MAQSFRRLGCEVVLFHKNQHILDREDVNAAEIVQKKFIEEGIDLILDSDLKEVKVEDGEKIIHYEVNSKPGSAAVDEILVERGVCRTSRTSILKPRGFNTTVDGVLW